MVRSAMPELSGPLGGGGQISSQCGVSSRFSGCAWWHLPDFFVGTPLPFRQCPTERYSPIVTCVIPTTGLV